MLFSRLNARTHACPCQGFTLALTVDGSGLGVIVVRYSFDARFPILRVLSGTLPGNVEEMWSLTAAMVPWEWDITRKLAASLLRTYCCAMPPTCASTGEQAARSPQEHRRYAQAERYHSSSLISPQVSPLKDPGTSVLAILDS